MEIGTFVCFEDVFAAYFYDSDGIILQDGTDVLFLVRKFHYISVNVGLYCEYILQYIFEIVGRGVDKDKNRILAFIGVFQEVYARYRSVFAESNTVDPNAFNEDIFSGVSTEEDGILGAGEIFQFYIRQFFLVFSG